MEYPLLIVLWIPSIENLKVKRDDIEDQIEDLYVDQKNCENELKEMINEP